MEAKTHIGEGGRMVVPVGFRKALDLQVGDEVILQLENDQMRLIPLRHAITLAQRKVRQYVSEGTSLVDALIQNRRAEAESE